MKDDDQFRGIFEVLAVHLSLIGPYRGAGVLRYHYLILERLQAISKYSDALHTVIFFHLGGFVLLHHNYSNSALLHSM